jgi:hypothetical protein
MTVQELLLQDSKVILPIGAAKLQQILNTLLSYKEDKAKLTKQLEIKSNMLEAAQMEILIADNTIHELDTALTIARQELQELSNVRLRCAIDLDLSDL